SSPSADRNEIRAPRGLPVLLDTSSVYRTTLPCVRTIRCHRISLTYCFTAPNPQARASRRVNDPRPSGVWRSAWLPAKYHAALTTIAAGGTAMAVTIRTDMSSTHHVRPKLATVPLDGFPGGYRRVTGSPSRGR